MVPAGDDPGTSWDDLATAARRFCCAVQDRSAPVETPRSARPLCAFTVAILPKDAENGRTLPVTPKLTSERRKLSFTLSRILALLAVSVFINYIDRGNLSIAAPMLKDELHLSAWQLGILLSSFFWTYASFQPVAGWLVDRFAVGWVMAAGFFLWSMATAATGLVHGFLVLLGVRLILGIGESVAYPSYSKILVRYFPEEKRGLANSLIVAGNTCGPGFGMFLGGMLMARYGWRSFFVVLGFGSLLWLVPWFRWMPGGPATERVLGPASPASAPTLSDILKLRSAWGTCAGLFCVNYLSYFLITWLPFYLVRERHFSPDKMASVAGASYLAAAVASILCGWLSDQWIKAGATPTRVRKTFLGTGLAAAGIFLVGCVVAGSALSIAMLILAAAAFGGSSSNMWGITQTLAGPQAAGRWTGFQNFVGNLAGVIAPALTGFVVDQTGEFFWPFVITAGVAGTGTLVWVLLVGPITPVVWGTSGGATNPGEAVIE
jgi:ACS family D-galactonate transporter-like MFS transporter